MTRIDARYALWGAALALLLALPAFAGFTGLAWEFSQWAGFAGALVCIVLSGAPIRPRSAQPPSLLSLRLHTALAWTALLAVLIHVGGLLLADRIVTAYLRPTAPLYQLAGIGAALLLMILVVLSQAGIRRRLWRSHRGFQAAHVIMACALALLVAVHVVVTARYLGGRGRRVLFVAATIGALLMLLRARRPAPLPGSAKPARAHTVFGRHSGVIVAVVAMCVVGLAGLVPDSVDAALREPLLRRTSALPLDFPHGKHGAINCLSCHHNYADGSGAALCVECHRSRRTDLKEGVEARFHGFCFGCHRHPAAALKSHGPVSGCSACHRAPT
ncbi:MAG TPA: cytochrome c3 family protein [Steroidobacteraceae bacterium]|nr:cytochrome c3 family protein [Steroidobacteraceae bacterium]